MDFSDEDKILIFKKLYQLMGFKATELINKFSNNWWTKVALTVYWNN